ncbi:ArsR family transcriptional regulator [Patescibacteria group bacterium]
MRKKNKKNFRALERIAKGFSNHRRIQIMELLKKEPELSVIELAEILHCNFKTISAHVLKLAISGLIMKKSDGHSVRHKLTMRGNDVLKFLRTLE